LGIRRWDALNDLFGAVVVDVRPELAAAWQALLRHPPEQRRPLEDELFRPPNSEKDLLAYADRVVGAEPRTRTETINRWGETAREHYRAIRRRAEELP